MKSYTVTRIAAERILRLKGQQKTACLFLLKEEMCERDPIRDEFIIILCEFVFLLSQFIAIVKKMLISDNRVKILVTHHQLSTMRVFTSAIKSLEARTIKEFGLSLQIH